MTIPVPGLVGASVFSSIQPLKTDPNPPSPSTLSGLKFLVAVLSSLKVKALTFAASRISSSLRGVGSIDAEDAWLLELLRAAPFLLANLEVAPAHHQKRIEFQTSVHHMNIKLRASYYCVFKSIWFSFSILGRQRKVHDLMGEAAKLLLKGRTEKKKGTFLFTSRAWRRA